MHTYLHTNANRSLYMSPYHMHLSIFVRIEQVQFEFYFPFLLARLNWLGLPSFTHFPSSCFDTGCSSSRIPSRFWFLHFCVLLLCFQCWFSESLNCKLSQPTSTHRILAWPRHI